MFSPTIPNTEDTNRTGCVAQASLSQFTLALQAFIFTAQLVASKGYFDLGVKFNRLPVQFLTSAAAAGISIVTKTQGKWRKK